MSGVFKGGWHPDKGTSLKKQVTGVFRRGDGSGEHTSHNAPPLSSLRDPSSFGPPPKRLPTQPIPPPSLSSVTGSSRGPPSVPSRSQAYPDGYADPADGAEAPRPYQVDTTGLSTAHLPAPPVRRPGSATEPLSPPPPYSATAAKPTPPRLPPRLPPRAGAGSPTVSSPSAPPAASTSSFSPVQSPPLLNQGAVDRLGAAGISVPGLGIGKSSSSPSSTTSPQPGSTAASSIGGLSSRFAKLGTSSSSSSSPTPPPPSEGTTLAQKQAALQTAASFRRDPSSVSMADARSAASTMNNFRQRHGDQVASGLKTAQGLNQKYGVTDRVGAFQQQQQQQQQLGDAVGDQSQSPAMGIGARSPAASPTPGAAAPSPISHATAVAGSLLGKKKPAPPPPPRRKPGLSAIGGSGGNASPPLEDTPPPVPLSTRPTF